MARRLYERAGFVHEGTAADGYRGPDGTYSNICFYEILSTHRERGVAFRGTRPDVETPTTIAPDAAAAARRLADARTTRASARSRSRKFIDAMEAEAKNILGTAFTADDPITGHPACLLIATGAFLDDEYERQSPRPIPDLPNRLTVEILGRILAVEIDDYGRAKVTGSGDAAGVNRATIADGDVVFFNDEGHPTRFSALLTRLLDDVYNDEVAAARASENDRR